MPASEFLNAQQEDEAVDWILEDYLPAGGLVILAGKPKEGKTTLAYELTVKVAKGLPFLNRQTRAAGVLILGLEEHPRDIRVRLRNLGAEELTNLHVYTGQINPSLEAFQDIKHYVTEYAIKLVLVDTLAAFWNVRDENDAAAVTQAMKPLLALARETGACVVLIHHARKSEGSNGDEIRGSGALFATVDVALILKRAETQTHRHLRANSRYHETPAEIVLELTESGYKALGDPAAINREAKRNKIKASLTEDPQDAKSIAKIAGVSPRDIHRLLNDLWVNGEAYREGLGRKGDPYRYSSDSIRATAPDIGGTPHETNPALAFIEVIEDVA
jgi:predicted ATP-dependent serine protease